MSQSRVTEPLTCSSMPSTRRLPSVTVVVSSGRPRARWSFRCGRSPSAAGWRRCPTGRRARSSGSFPDPRSGWTRTGWSARYGRRSRSGCRPYQFARWVVRIAPGHVVRQFLGRLPDEADAAAEHIVGARERPDRGPCANGARRRDRHRARIGTVAFVAHPEQRLPLFGELDLVLNEKGNTLAFGGSAQIRTFVIDLFAHQ